MITTIITNATIVSPDPDPDPPVVRAGAREPLRRRAPARTRYSTPECNKHVPLPPPPRLRAGHCELSLRELRRRGSGLFYGSRAFGAA